MSTFCNETSCDEVARLHADDLTFGPGNRLFFTRMSVGAPNEIYRLDIPESKGNAAASHPYE